MKTWKDAVKVKLEALALLIFLALLVVIFRYYAPRNASLSPTSPPTAAQNAAAYPPPVETPYPPPTAAPRETPDSSPTAAPHLEF